MPVLLLYITTVPLLVIAALVLSYRLPGKWRALRLLGLATRYLFVEVAVSIEHDGTALPTDSGDGSTSDAPLIVPSRHAGPADSFLLLHEIVGHDRQLGAVGLPARSTRR